jgi:RHS repeat-associated protein
MTIRRTRTYTSLAVVALAFAAAPICWAQDQVPKRGFYPAGSYALSEIETINTTNGNVSFRIPLGSLPAGRGGLTASLALFYNTKLYDSFPSVIYPSGPPVSVDQLYASPHGGWRYAFDFKLHRMIRSDFVFYECPDPLAYPHYKHMMSFPDGSTHEFRPAGYFSLGDAYYPVRSDGWVETCPGGYFITTGMTYYSTDGTYMRLDVEYDGDSNPDNNNWTLSLPDGSRVTGRNSARHFYDRNGNEIRFRSVTLANGNPATRIFDYPMQREMIIEYTGTGTDYVRVTGVNGEVVTYTLTWSTIRAGVYESRGSDGVTYTFGMPWVNVVDQISLPQQVGALSYLLTYNTNTTYCEVSSITIPSGARADYTYQSGGSAVNPDQVMDNHVTRKVLSYSLEYDGATTSTTEEWTYVIPRREGGEAIITGPDGGAIHEWSYGNFSDPATEWRAGLVYKSQRPDGTVVERIWAPNTPYNPGGSVPMNAYLKTEFTSVRDAAGNLVKTAIRDYSHDKNGNLTQVAEYDWVNYGDVPRDAVTNEPTGIPAGATPKRVTIHTCYSPTPDAGDYWTYDADAYHQATAPRLRNAVASSEVRSGFSASQALSRTELFYDNATTTGNLIESKSWDSHKGGVYRPITRPLGADNSVSITRQYGPYGNVTLTTDARGVQTRFTYDAVNGFTDLYVTKTEAAYQTPVVRTTTAQYDFYGGLVTQSTDFDNNVSVRTTYDVFGRPTLVQEAYQSPTERQTATEYSDVNRRVIVRADLNSAGDRKLVSVQHYDQLGRIRLTRQLEDASTQSATDETTGIKAQTRYKFSGSNSYQLASNPYRAATSSGASSEPTMGWTRTKYDNGGRVTEVQTFSGAGLPAPWGANTTSTGSVTTTYNGIFTTVADQAGKVRRSMVDGLARLARVDEPDSNDLGATDWPVHPTQYLYDALDNLTRVTQGSQPSRVFTYSSLARLISAQNPESGTVQYRYDNNGNLDQKTDARGLITTYVYDELNRVASRSYTAPAGVPATPAVTYSYDSSAVTFSKGRLTRVSSSVSVYDYLEYDELGRVKRSKQTTEGVEYSMSYGYDRAGNMTSQTYPSGRVVTTGYDNAGRIASVASGGKTYADQFTYTPHGAVASMSLGDRVMSEQTGYNSRLQPTMIELRRVSGSQLILGLDYEYNTAGQANNNGNVLRQTIRVGTGGGTTTISQSYDYDELNRIKTATETGVWSQAFTYDRWGNRRSVTNTGLLPPPFNGLIDEATNRIVGFTYDAAGNVLNDGAGNGFQYDGENRQARHVGTATTEYFYDGDGRRVKKVGSDGTTVWVYNVAGQLIGEYTTATPPGGGTSYLTTDHLGSTRVVTDSGGAVRGRHDYLVFGEEIPSNVGARASIAEYGLNDRIRQKFTQKERDNESGLDYFLARYYSSAQGRFGSTDPTYFQVSMAIDPQLFNLYGYARNNPLKWIDPTGERLFLRGDVNWLLSNVLYEMAGGQAEFDRYFEIQGGQVVLRAGVSTANVTSGVQQVLDLVNATENHLYFAGTDGGQVADLFQNTRDNTGRLNEQGRRISDDFTGNNATRRGGTAVGTSGRGGGSPQPANLVSGDPVFAVIAYNTGAVLTQERTPGQNGITFDFDSTSRGSRLLVIQAQLQGNRQVIRPVSYFIHESAENLVFARIGASQANYRTAHSRALEREAIIRRDLGITGGFSGGLVTRRVP